MTGRLRRRLTYDEFEQRVRGLRRSDLLYAIGQLTSDHANRGVRPPKERLLLPWALACAAKESLRGGNDHRDSGVTPRDLARLCAAYNELRDPFEGRGPYSGVDAFLTRISYEQFPFQSSEYEEMSRPHAMFDTAAREADTKIMTPDFWRRTLGCSISQFSAVALLLSVAAAKNGGVFRPSWLEQPNLADVVAELPAGVVRGVLREHYSASVSELRDEVDRFRSRDPLLRRYDFNPLVAHPFVEMAEEVFVAPSHPLILRRASPNALYYAALPLVAGQDQDDFFGDLGRVFEAYVGMQLRSLQGAEVVPQIEYGNNERSIDWFVIWPNLVLFVEVKATRMTLQARMGTDQLGEVLRRTIGWGFEQIGQSEHHVSNLHPAFGAIPRDRPHVGMVVTLEPYYLANSPLIRDLLPQPTIPSIVASVRELEHFVSVPAQEGGADFLIDMVHDPERSTWALAAALGDRGRGARNALLDEAFSQLPWK